MQYHEVMVFANYPFISTPANGSSGSTSESRRTCSQSAKAIGALLHLYERLWTLGRLNIQCVHMCFSATLLHLYIACTSDLEDVQQQAISDLDVCCHALSQLSRSWKTNALRALASLARIRQVWQSWLQDPQVTTLSRNFFDAQQSVSESRWAAIDLVIQSAMETAAGQDLTPKEDVSWLEGWVQMQAMGCDPFSVACA